MVSYPEVQTFMARFPETPEAIYYGTPTYKVGKKVVTRRWSARELARAGEGADVLVVHCEEDRAKMLAEAEPLVYFRTPHYHGYDFVLVRLDRVDRADLEELMETAWRQQAPAALVQAFEHERKRTETAS